MLRRRSAKTRFTPWDPTAAHARFRAIVDRAERRVISDLQNVRPVSEPPARPFNGKKRVPARRA